MKKIKFKRKSKRIFFSTPFIAFILIMIIFSASSAYALLKQDINIIGSVTGQKVYTYYFRKPSNWNNIMYAHIWANDDSENIIAGTSWPGLQMEQVADSIYKIDITSDMAFYSGHNYIIFNDYGGHQTYDIPLNNLTNNHQIFELESYTSSEYTRMFVKTPNTWTKVYAYMWINGTETSNAPWPGVEITANKFSADGYYIITDHTYNMIIFNNGSYIKTGDLAIPSQQDMTYDAGKSNDWYSYYNYGAWHNYALPEKLFPSHSHS